MFFNTDEIKPIIKMTKFSGSLEWNALCLSLENLLVNTRRKIHKLALR